MTGGRFDFLQGQIVPVAPGVWRYLLEAASYYTPPVTPADAALLHGLGHDRIDEEIDDISYREFAHRLAPGEAALRASGEWLYPHAWITVFLPSAATGALVSETLAGLTAAELGPSGLILLYPLRTDRLRAPLTRVPDSELVWLFALLRTAGASSARYSTTVPIGVEHNVHAQSDADAVHSARGRRRTPPKYSQPIFHYSTSTDGPTLRSTCPSGCQATNDLGARIAKFVENG
ncbi:MAG: hypothetical protein JO268_06205 [Pseudonocardiales bacterium]|nr:hypothetical protein [Pseudonocardiales bacterium]